MIPSRAVARVCALGFGAIFSLAMAGIAIPAVGGGAGNSAPVDPAVLTAGERAFAQCKGCHSIAVDGHDSVGPNLYGVFGKKAGTNSATYKYSVALKGSGLTWDEAGLNSFLAGPAKAVPGTKMPYRGLTDDAARKALIAYLRVTSKAK